LKDLISQQEFINKYQKVDVEEYPNNVLSVVKNPKVSLLLTTYNHANYISKSIDSILEQKIPFEYEIIIGDDDSTDGTREICKAYAEKYPNLIRLFLHKRENNIKVLGRPCLIFQLSYNLYQARGKYLTSLSGDDYWNDPNKIVQQVTYLDEHPECSICYHEWAKLHDDSDEIEYLRDCTREYPLPITWLMKNVFQKIPESMFNVLQEDDYMLFHLSTYGTIDYIKGIKPALYRVHANNTWTTTNIDFKRNSEIHTSQQLHNTYGNSTHGYNVKIKLYRSLLKYLFDKRTSKNIFIKLVYVIKAILQYNLLPSILKLESIKWKSRIQNQLKINAIKSKVKVAFIKKNGITLNSQTPQIFTNTSVNIDSGVYATKSKYILDSFFGENKIKNLSSFGYTNIINETDYFCSIQHGPWDNYYHWYIDSLPRIWGLHKPDLKKLPTIKLFLSKMIKTEDEKILQAILPDNVVIVKVPRKTLVKGNHAIYLPFLSKDCSGALDKEYLDFYLQKASSLFNLNTKNNYPSKIYISRKNAEKRKFLNENEVIALVKNEGYTVVELEKLNIAEQAALFYHAKKIVAQHGAALTNLLYAQHTSVVEIFHAPNQHLNHYRDLCSQKELDYTPIYLDGKDKNENLSIDLNYLKTIL
jgi:glycosyltransferase involved in cell wall biosynthesis